MATHANSTPMPDRDRPALAALRRLLADRIERYLAFLDLLDGDVDLEPSLGAPECAPRDTHALSCIRIDYDSSQLAWAGGVTDDREDDAGDDGEEPNALMYWGEAEPDVRRVRRARA